MVRTEQETRRAVIYRRISEDRTGLQAGVERQGDDCTEVAARNGWPVVAVLTDNDISAYSGKVRPGYRRMLEMIADGTANAVIAWHPDRLYRQLYDLGDLVKVVQSTGTVIRTVMAGDVDLNTASGVMNAEILASVSKHQVAHMREQVARKKEQNVAKGEYRGGPRPFGYEADGRTVRPEEAAEVLAATRAVLQGASLRSIEADWIKRGIVTVARRKRLEDGSRTEPISLPWKAREIRELLLRVRNAGLIESHGQIVGKAVWPAIVPEDEWHACRDILLHPGRRTTPGNARKWLGSGIYQCGVPGCGGTMRVVGGGRTKDAAYRCRDKGHLQRVAGPLDDFIERLVVARLSRPDAVDLFTPAGDGKGAERSVQLASLRAKLNGFTEDYDADLITRSQFLDGTAKTLDRIAALEKVMAASVSVSVLASVPLGTPDVAAAWKDYHLDRKRSIIAALMTVTVSPVPHGRPKGFQPGSGKSYFNPEFIDIDWVPTPPR